MPRFMLPQECCVATTVGRPLTPAIKINRILTIAGPTFSVAALFLASWVKHDELHPKHLEAETERIISLM